ncbi:hypothetical protein BCF55_0855 [Hydrogenivirga caldilitoris]|uniref:Uncharacterized protein n=1 Tax=Hydrogenivirga caldilitoris TaxID=246264 RepID=A0A497XR07_9AQUI|nr:hypothetical protein [Hydrogenivirga caldilitoris]RLJ70579.1 hypothetical protein BCF55_0855 [Hydrogenivirga caldilitoris]
MEEQYVAVPFSLVGFFVTNRPIEESIRDDLTPEEMEKLQDLVAKFLFKEGVKVALYPSVVPPDQAEEAVSELEGMIFGEEE